MFLKTISLLTALSQTDLRFDVGDVGVALRKGGVFVFDGAGVSLGAGTLDAGEDAGEDAGAAALNLVEGSLEPGENGGLWLNEHGKGGDGRTGGGS